MKILGITKILHYILIISSATFVACGGGGGGGGDAVPLDDQNEPGSSINHDLAGHLFMGGDNEGWLLALSSGRYTRVPGVDWEEEDDSVYIPIADYTAESDPSGTEFLVVVRGCSNSTEHDLMHNDCLVIHDQYGGVVSGSSLLDGISTGAKLSNNREFLAFFYNNSFKTGTSNDVLIILDRNFGAVSTAVLTDNNARSLDWLPNGQIVYSHDQSIYITAPYNAEGSLLYEFAESEGEPDYITVSPDGSRFAFSLVTYRSFYTERGTTWIMNADGTDLHRLCYFEGDEGYQSIRYPAWSPDGKYILNMIGDLPDNANVLGYMPGLYAIKSDSRDLKLNDISNRDNVIRIKSYYRRDVLNHAANNVLDYDFDSNGPYTWTP